MEVCFIRLPRCSSPITETLNSAQVSLKENATVWHDADLILSGGLWADHISNLATGGPFGYLELDSNTLMAEHQLKVICKYSPVPGTSKNRDTKLTVELSVYPRGGGQIQSSFSCCNSRVSNAPISPSSSRQPSGQVIICNDNSLDTRKVSPSILFNDSCTAGVSLKGPESTIEFAHLYRLNGGKEDPSMKKLLGYLMTEIKSESSSKTSAFYYEVGQLALLGDIDVCNQLWDIITSITSKQDYTEPNFVGCLANIILYCNLSGKEDYLEHVLKALLKANIDSIEHEPINYVYQFLRSMGIFFDSLNLRSVCLKLREQSEEFKIVSDSWSLKWPEYSPYFERIHQGLIRLEKHIFPCIVKYTHDITSPPSPKRIPSATKTTQVSKFEDPIPTPQSNSNDAQEGDAWYDNYIYLKSLMLSSKLQDSVKFSELVLTDDRKSPFLWFLLEELAYVSQHPNHNNAKSCVELLDRLVTDEYNGYPPEHYYTHAIKQLRRIIHMSAITVETVREILLSDGNGQKGLLLSWARKQLGANLEGLSDAGSDYIQTPANPSLYSKADRYVKLFESRDNMRRIFAIEFGEEIYVSLQAKRDLNDERLFKSDDLIEHFLRGPPHTLVVLGKSGAGKSTFAKKQSQILGDLKLEGKKFYPVFVNLPSVDNPSKLGEYVQKVMKSDYEKFTHTHKVVFILDGFDELKESGTIKLVKENWSLLEKYHVIITYRYNLQETRYDLENKFGADAHIISARQLIYMVLQPFGDDQIKDYIRTFHKNQKVLQYSPEDITTKIFSSPSLKEAAESPFILSLIMKVLPAYLIETGNKSTTNLSRYEIYNRFVDDWHSKRAGLSSSSVRSKFESFSMTFAQTLFRKNVIVAKLVKKENIESAFGVKPPATWTDVRELIKGSLVRRFQATENDEQFAFVHRSIQEFFVAKKAIQEIEDGKWREEDAVFSKFQDKDFLVKQFLADYTFKNIVFVDKLKSVILESAQENVSERLINAASVAITILNYARIPLHNMTLHKVKIPGPDLSQAVLQNVDFTGANLSKVTFKDADIRGCKFDKCILEGTDFGQLPKLIHKSPVNCGCVEVNGSFVQFYTGSNNNISVWDLETCESIINLSHSTSVISSISMAKKKDHSFVVSGDRSGSIYVWDAVTCDIKFRIPKESIGGGQITCINTSPKLQEYMGLDERNDLFFVVGTMDGLMAFMKFDTTKDETDSDSIKVLHQIRLSGAIYSIDFFYDGQNKFIIYGGSLPHVEYRKIDLDCEKETVTLGDELKLDSGNRQVKSIRAIKYQERYKIAVAVDKEIHIFDSSTLESKAVVLKDWHEKAIRDVQWVPADSGEPEFLVTSGADRMVYLWNVSEATVIRPFLGHTKEIPDLKVFMYMDEYYLLGCCQDNSAWIWSITSRELIKKANGHRKAINTISIIQSAVYDVQPRSLPEQSDIYTQQNKAVSKILNSSGLIVTGSSDRFIKVWDFATGNCLVSRFVNDLVTSVATRKVYEDVQVYFVLNNYQTEIQRLDPFCPDFKPTVIVKTGRDIIRNFNIFYLDGEEYLFSCTKKSMICTMLSDTASKPEELKSYPIIENGVDTFAFKTYPDMSLTILFTVEGGIVKCRKVVVDKGEHIVCVEEDPLTEIEPEAGISNSPANPVFSKVAPESNIQSVFLGDETGLVYRFDVPLDKDNEPSQELLYEGESPIYACETFVVDGSEYVVFGDRDGFLRIVKAKENDGEKLYERQIHNQVRAIKYDTETHTLVTTGENGFMYVWIPFEYETPIGESKINLSVVWSSHTTLRGDQISSLNLPRCSQPNRFLLEQLKKPPIIN